MFKIPDLDEVDSYGLSPSDTLQPIFKSTNRKNESSGCTSDSGEEASNSVALMQDKKQTGTNQVQESFKIPAPKPSVSASSSKFVAAFSKLKESKFHENVEVASEQRGAESSGNKTMSTKAINQTGSKTYSVLVNPRQKGNPLLKHIQNVPWEFAEIEPDYVMGQRTCALFLSLKYHNLFPNYIHERLKSLGKNFELRVLLVLVDVTDPHVSLRELSKIAILTDCTLMLAWSAEEAGRHIETYKAFENKPADLIMEKQEASVHSNLIDALTSVRSVNKTDALNLLSVFGTMEKIMKATPDELSLCPGMGPQKAKRLHDVLHQPFLKSKSPKKA